MAIAGIAIGGVCLLGALILLMVTRPHSSVLTKPSGSSASARLES